METKSSPKFGGRALRKWCKTQQDPSLVTDRSSRNIFFENQKSKKKSLSSFFEFDFPLYREEEFSEIFHVE